MRYRLNTPADFAREQPYIDGIIREGTVEAFERLMGQINPRSLLRKDNFAGTLARILFMAPEGARVALAIALSEAIEHNPRLPYWVKLFVPAFFRALPDAMIRMMENAGTTEDELVAQFTGDAAMQLPLVEQRLRATNGWFDGKYRLLHKSEIHPVERGEETDLHSLFELHNELIVQGKADTCMECFPELANLGGEGRRVIVLKGEAVAMPTAGLEKLTEQGEANLGLFYLILIARFQDMINRPHSPHTLNACWEMIGSCPSALRALNNIVVTPEQQADATYWLNWLSRVYQKGGMGTLTDPEDLVEYDQATAVIQGVLSLFTHFEAELRIEGKAQVCADALGKAHWQILVVRDGVDDMSTAQSREEFKQGFLGRLKGLLEHFKKGSRFRVWLRRILCSLPIAFLLNMGGFVISGALIFYADWNSDLSLVASVRLILAGVVGTFVSRLLIVIFDGLANAARGAVDIVNPVDGTGFGSIFQELTDGLRQLGLLRELTPIEIEARLKRVKKASQPWDFFRQRGTTVTTVVCAVAAGSLVWIYLGRPPGLGISLAVSGLIILIVAETYARGWRVNNEDDDKRTVPLEDRRRAYRQIIEWGTKGALTIAGTGILVFGGLFVLRSIVGDIAVDNSLALIKAASAQAVADAAAEAKIPLSERDRECYARNKKVLEGEPKRNLRPGTTCELNPNVFPCDCDAEIPAHIINGNPKLKAELNKLAAGK